MVVLDIRARSTQHSTMRAMLLRVPSPSHDSPPALELTDIDMPTPGAGELLVRVTVCAVCRTDLDLVQGRLAPREYPVVPGHQVVGTVERMDPDARGFAEGDRVGVAWIHSACGACEWCRADRENLCPNFRGTGCDANGGYAEYLTVPANFAHRLPAGFADASVAPLLCAGAIGWRALRLTELRDGQVLGLAGFGASGHLVIQLARVRYPSSPMYVFARNAAEREFARQLGAAWAGDASDEPPTAVHAIIDTTPAWKPVVESLRHLVPGGRLVINAIRKDARDRDALLGLDYARDLWMEREVKSVANVTRRDVRDLLEAAREIHLQPNVTELPLERANDALTSLASGAAIRGATVLRVV